MNLCLLLALAKKLHLTAPPRQIHSEYHHRTLQPATYHGLSAYAAAALSGKLENAFTSLCPAESDCSWPAARDPDQFKQTDHVLHCSSVDTLFPPPTSTEPSGGETAPSNTPTVCRASCFIHTSMKLQDPTSARYRSCSGPRTPPPRGPPKPPESSEPANDLKISRLHPH